MPKLQAKTEKILGVELPPEYKITPKQYEMLLAGSVLALTKWYGYCILMLDRATVKWAPGMVAKGGPGAMVRLSKGRYIFSFDPDYFTQKDMTLQHFAFAIGHEAVHVALEHIQYGIHYSGKGSDARAGVPVPKSILPKLPAEVKAKLETRGGRQYLPYHHQLWMIACDRIVNKIQVNGGVGELHRTWIPVNGVDLDEHSVEHQYALFYRHVEEQTTYIQATGGYDCESLHPFGDDMQPFDAVDGSSDLEPKDNSNGPTGSAPTLEQLDDQVRANVVTVAEAQKQAGNSAGDLERYIGSQLAPQTDWRDHLAVTVTMAARGDGDSTYARIDRRLLAGAGIAMPLPTRPCTDTIVVAVDTSGSVSEAELSQFLSELAGCIAQLNPQCVITLPCDAQVYDPIVLADLNNSTDFDAVYESIATEVSEGFRGGGGTSFVPPFDWVRDNGFEHIDLFVYLTDGYGSAMEDPPSYPVVWCTTGNQEFVNWGQIVPITFEETHR